MTASPEGKLSFNVFLGEALPGDRQHSFCQGVLQRREGGIVPMENVIPKGGSDVFGGSCRQVSIDN